jgi:hypothetical protein
MNLYNFDLLPILLAMIVIVSVVLWVAIRNYKNFILMFFLIPLALYSGWTVYTTFDKLLGYPTIDIFEKDTLYLSHFENPDIAEWVYVWVLKPGEAKPKAIMIPATEKNKDKLAEAESETSKGIPIYMEVQVDGQGQTAGEAELNIYDFQSNWDDVEKERQRQEDQQERFVPGPARPSSPPHSAPDSSSAPTRLIIDDAEDQYGGNDMIIWREDGNDTEVEPNPYKFNWGEKNADQFLP